MDADLCLEYSRDLLISHSEGSRSYIHRYCLLKLLITKNLFLRFPNIQQGSEPGSRKADSGVVTTIKSPSEYLSLAFRFPTYIQACFNGVLFETRLSVRSCNKELWKTTRQWLKSDKLLCHIPSVILGFGGCSYHQHGMSQSWLDWRQGASW